MRQRFQQHKYIYNKRTTDKRKKDEHAGPSVVVHVRDKQTQRKVRMPLVVIFRWS